MTFDFSPDAIPSSTQSFLIFSQDIVWRSLFRCELMQAASRSLFRQTQPSPHLLGRFRSLLFDVLSANYFVQQPDSSVDCQLIIHVIVAFGEISVIASSLVFVLRATVLAGWRDPFSVILSICWIAQAALTLYTSTALSAGWEFNSCLVTKVKTVFVSGYWAALVVDILAFISIARTLIGNRSSSPSSPLSKVSRVLLKDGCLYLLTAIMFHLTSAILIQLNLNPALDIIASPLAVVFPSIVACRAFTELSTKIRGGSVNVYFWDGWRDDAVTPEFVMSNSQLPLSNIARFNNLNEPSSPRAPDERSSTTLSHIKSQDQPLSDEKEFGGPRDNVNSRHSSIVGIAP